MATIFMVYQELGAKASMADLNLMAIFARVVEAGSFSEAARRMGCSRSAVSKAVAKLEKSLGAHLLNRTTRYLSLTEIGAAVAEHSSRILEEATEAERLVGSLNNEARGILRVSASVAFGTLHVAPALAKFCRAIRSLRLTLALRTAGEPGRGGCDVAIHVTGDPSSIWWRPLAPVRRNWRYT
jgi:DNA-binding transcriptional LysR family regulator